MAQVLRHSLWIILAAGTVFFLNLGVPQLWDEDEPKNAACAREMIERGDWVVPMFNYELRTAKPVLVYWFMMTAYKVFGVSEFGARFWSAMLGIGTCLLTYGIGRRLFQPVTGLWAALILAAALMFGVASRAATPDAPLIFFSTLALAIFVWGLPRATVESTSGFSDPARQLPWTSHEAAALRQQIPQSWLTYVGIYGAMGLAVLAKGPVGVALPTIIMMGYLWMRRWNSLPQPTLGVAPVPAGPAAKLSRWNWLARLARALAPDVIWRVGWVLRPITALAVVALVALPWYIWVGMRTDGAWIAGFLGKHNVSRFVQPLEGHSGPIFYYVLAVMIGFFPWSVFLPAACAGLWRRMQDARFRTAGDEFCAAWAVLYIGFFSLASTKLPSYVLPAYPALALITARWLMDWLTAPSTRLRWLPRWGFGSFAAVGITFLVAIPILMVRFMPDNWLIGWAGLIPLAGGLLALYFYERQQMQRAANTFGAASLVFAACLFGIVAVQINPHQTSAALMQGIFARSAQPQIAAFDYFEPSLAYYAGRPVKRLKTLEQAVTFLQTSPDAYLIIREKDWSKVQQSVQSPLNVIERRPRFLKSGDILLLTAEGSALAAQPIPATPTAPVPREAVPRTATATPATVRH